MGGSKIRGDYQGSRSGHLVPVGIVQGLRRGVNMEDGSFLLSGDSIFLRGSNLAYPQRYPR